MVPEKFYYELDEFKYNTESKQRHLSGLRELDFLTSGFEMGCVTIWTGLTNSGKTTMITTVVRNAVDSGEKVFVFNGEQTKDDFKNNLYKISSDKKDIYSVQYKDTCVFDYFVRDERARELAKKYDRNIYVFNNEMPRDIDTLLYSMEECRRIHGVRVFVLDNFMQIDISKDDVFTEQSKIMEKLRTFAVNKGVCIHLVAHPRKIERFTTRLSLYDIAGTMNLANKAYNIISVMRVDTMDRQSKEYEKLARDMMKQRYNIEESDGILEVLKTKGIACGLVGLIYDRATGSYTEQAKLTTEVYERMRNIYTSKSNCPF